MTQSIVFTIPRPPAKKNKRRMFRNRKTGKMFPGSDESVQRRKDTIHLLAIEAMRKARLRCDEASDVRVMFWYLRQTDEVKVRVEFTDAITPDLGFDVQNVAELALDAFEGAIYENDKQVRQVVIGVEPDFTSEEIT